jgi:hypothetical protein
MLKFASHLRHRIPYPERPKLGDSLDAGEAERRPENNCTYLSHRLETSSNQQRQARLAQSVARETLNLKVVGSSPTSGFKQFFFAHARSLSRWGGGEWTEDFRVNAVRASRTTASIHVPQTASLSFCLPLPGELEGEHLKRRSWGAGCYTMICFLRRPCRALIF